MRDLGSPRKSAKARMCESTKVFAGCGVKSGTGGRMRSGAEGEHRTGEDDGRSRTLDSTGSAQPIARGGQGLRPPCLPRGRSGKFGHGMHPKGLPQRSAEWLRSNRRLFSAYYCRIAIMRLERLWLGVSTLITQTD